jgi:hypothetical protein
VLTEPENVVISRASLVKKAELSTQTKALRVVRGVDDGSKTDLGTSSNQAVANKLQCDESWGAQGASWEILK